MLFRSDYSTQDVTMHLGSNSNENSDSTNGYPWSGYIQDFRYTSFVARYDYKVINGVTTMVHRGTEIPALPSLRQPLAQWKGGM